LSIFCPPIDINKKLDRDDPSTNEDVKVNIRLVKRKCLRRSDGFEGKVFIDAVGIADDNMLRYPRISKAENPFQRRDHHVVSD
jgi:hypothetical protein